MIQFKDDTQVLEDSDGIALAKKSKSGPQAIPLFSCKELGSCFSAWEEVGVTMGLLRRAVLKADQWFKDKSIRVKDLAGHVLGHQPGGPVAKWNLGYWPCPLFTSISTNNNDMSDF